RSNEMLRLLASPMTTPDQKKSIYPRPPVEARSALRSNTSKRSEAISKHCIRWDHSCCAWRCSVPDSVPSARHPSLRCRQNDDIPVSLRWIRSRSKTSDTCSYLSNMSEDVVISTLIRTSSDRGELCRDDLGGFNSE